jgi:hypothetical protein
MRVEHRLEVTCELSYETLLFTGVTAAKSAASESLKQAFSSQGARPIINLVKQIAIMAVTGPALLSVGYSTAVHTSVPILKSDRETVSICRPVVRSLVEQSAH